MPVSSPFAMPEDNRRFAPTPIPAGDGDEFTPDPTDSPEEQSFPLPQILAEKQSAPT